MRIRIRFSLQKDANSSIRNTKIAPVLADARFVQRGRTGTWQADGLTWGQAQRAIGSVFAGLSDSGPGCIDHVWVYAENESPGSAVDDEDEDDSESA